MKTYWISFADEKGSLGCCIVDGESIHDALERARTLGINPGGEAMLIEMPNDNETAFEEISLWGKNRLISPEELESNNYKRTSNLDKLLVKKILESDSVSFICNKCNDETNNSRNQDIQ